MLVKNKKNTLPRHHFPQTSTDRSNLPQHAMRGGGDRGRDHPEHDLHVGEKNEPGDKLWGGIADEALRLDVALLPCRRHMHALLL